MQAEILLQRWTNLMSIVSKIVNFSYARFLLRPQRATNIFMHKLSCPRTA